MLDKRKVRLMTRLALYEETQGKEDFRISEYYRKDYTGIHIFSSIIWVSIGYVCVAALVAFAGLDLLLENMSNALFLMLLAVLGIGYIGTVVIFAIISGHIYNQKHREARMRVKKYNHDLIRLLRWYEKENR